LLVSTTNIFTAERIRD